MSEQSTVAIGLDMGTGGARAVAVSLDGDVVASGRSILPEDAMHVSGSMAEQEPLAWTAAAQAALRELCGTLPAGTNIIGVSVDATSGTFLLADGKGTPLTAGIMYNDLRGAQWAEEADLAVAGCLEPYGIRIAPAFALPKIVQLVRSGADLVARSRRVVHQTDWLVGMLCGRYDVTDISTALKTGADPGRLAWPDALSSQLGIPLEWLPEIVLPGTQVGEVTAEAAALTGLPVGTPVMAGCTDGTAGCLASGARHVGDLNVTLGTTLVFKAIAERPLIDPHGAVYNHRHPAGGYLPGAASTTGGDWIGRFLPGANLDELATQAADLLPTGRIAYPLVKQGERFPFSNSEAVGFGLDDIESPPEQFAAGMEGIAMLERLGIDSLEQLGLSVGPTVYATGGGAANDTWLRIRASVCRRSFAVPRVAECAVGAAVLAATPYVGDCSTAIAALIRAGRQVEPDPQWIGAYEDCFPRFCSTLRERGYL